VFWLVGQSNAAGPVSGFWLANPFLAGRRYGHLQNQPRVQIWWPGDSDLRPSSPPGWESYATGYFWPVNNSCAYPAEGGFGPEASFGDAAQRALGEPVHLFKFPRIVALHPDAPQTFSKRADRETVYDEMMAEWRRSAAHLRAQNLVPKVRGVLWVHGESDFFPNRAISYGTHLARFIHDVRADVLRTDPDNGPIRFVISEMHDRHVPAAQWDRNEAELRAAQLDVVRTVPDCALADVDDLTLDQNSTAFVHFDAVGILTLGERLFAAWRSSDRER
jgi:hypothetical protein